MGVVAVVLVLWLGNRDSGTAVEEGDLTAKVACRMYKGKVLFIPQLFDKSGKQIKRVSRSLRKQLRRPRVDVFNAADRKIYSFPVKYG